MRAQRALKMELTQAKLSISSFCRNFMDFVDSELQLFLGGGGSLMDFLFCQLAYKCDVDLICRLRAFIRANPYFSECNEKDIS